MSANFVFEDTGKVRTTSFSVAERYNIEDFVFYVSTAYGKEELQAFLLLKNQNNIMEIVELSRKNISNQYVSFGIPVNQRLRVANERVSMSLLVFDTKNSIYKISPELNTFILTDNYDLARQVFFAQEVGRKAQLYYAKIASLAEEVEEIYEKMKKEGE